MIKTLAAGVTSGGAVSVKQSDSTDYDSTDSHSDPGRASCLTGAASSASAASSAASLASRACPYTTADGQLQHDDARLLNVDPRHVIALHRRQRYAHLQLSAVRSCVPRTDCACATCTQYNAAMTFSDAGELERVFSLFASDDESKVRTTPGTLTSECELDRSYRESTVKWLRRSAENEWLFAKVMCIALRCNHQYWDFDLPWMPDELQLARYDGNEHSQGHYDYHLDVGAGEQTATRKLSLSVQLSDSADYEGGDLVVMNHRRAQALPRERGSVILFPSYLLHQVQRVRKGTRYSLVAWFHGVPFR